MARKEEGGRTRKDLQSASIGSRLECFTSASKIFQNIKDLQSASIGSRLECFTVKCIFLYFVSLPPKSFPSMQVLPGLISVYILMDTPGTLGKKLGSFFTFSSPVKKQAFRIDVCNMCLPWAITNWVWEFYSFKNALGAQSLSQRPRHGLGTDGKIFLKLYDFLNILTRSI